VLKLVRIELYKIFKKWRTYIGFIAIAILVGIVELAMSIEGERSVHHLTRDLQQSFVFVGHLLNAYSVSYVILGSLFVHIPFLVTLVAGDLLAGEATAGTYRLLITRPLSRFKLVTSKFISGFLYTCALIFLLGILSLGAGALIFGIGELMVTGNAQIIVFAQNDVLWRFICAYLFACLSMSVVMSLAFLFSSFVENAIGPIITTMAIIIVFIIVSHIPIDFFEGIRPYLFTSYMDSWRSFFDSPPDYGDILKSGLVLLGHIILFFSAAVFIFQRKDILS
jgi:ABC-2 type transport system permease protein